ncbi:MAG: hypothetical protein PVF27_09520 [Gemmatimonadales bacterium]
MTTAKHAYSSVVTTVALGACLVTGCTQRLTGPGSFTRLDTRAPPPNAGTGLAYVPEFTVAATSSTVAIEASFWGFACGDRLDPQFSHPDDTLTFRLRFDVQVKDPTCALHEVVTDYVAIFDAVPVGRYAVRVEHVIERADTALTWDAGTVDVR